MNPYASVSRASFVVLFLFLLQLSGGDALAQELIWSQTRDLKNSWGPSTRAQSSSSNLNTELADDFDIVGTITRIDVSGFNSFQSSLTPAFYGLYVRFYAQNADGTPGALQREYFLGPNDANLWKSAEIPSDFRVTLSPAFNASGQHFVSVQAVTDPAVWDQKWWWRSANTNAVRGQRFYYRDLSGGGGVWSHSTPYGAADSDLAFSFYGTRTLPVSNITGLSTVSAAHAGRIKIQGVNFGATQGAGVVRIGGAVAPVSNWSDTSITAYVPDTAPLGVADVQVVTSGGASNPAALNVTARQRDGQVRWRFQADDRFIQGRPGIGPDGTIYVGGLNGHLYALTPEGGVKWIFRVPGFISQSVAVGADGTIYFASDATLWALNPSGTLKWKFEDVPTVTITAGPNVGPDGNIYGVSVRACRGACPDLLGLGAFAFSPAGQLLWNRLEYIGSKADPPPTREIFFDSSGQLYFIMGNQTNFLSLHALKLNGSARGFREAAGSHPALAPNGHIYTVTTHTFSPSMSMLELSAFDSSGSLVRKFFTEGARALSPPDIGADGTIYVSHNNMNLIALNPDGTERWRFTGSGMGELSGPVVSPSGTFIVVGGYDYSQPGFVHGFDNTGTQHWTVNCRQRTAAASAPSRARASRTTAPPFTSARR